MKVQGLACFAVIWVLMLICGAVAGSLFEYPPEQYGPEWSTPFPYQRNIDWDFSVDPLVSSASQPDYEGTDDEFLKGSDYVEFCGSAQWYAQAVSQAGKDDYVGVIGIDNRQGSQDLVGGVKFHIDNWDRMNELKRVWKEIDFIEGPGVDTNGDSVVDRWPDIDEENPLPGGLVIPCGYSLVDTWWGKPERIDDPAGLNPELYRENVWWRVSPNPPWEELQICFRVPAGTYAFIDRVHIATECVPEPATIGFLALGSLFIITLSRKI